MGQPGAHTNAQTLMRYAGAGIPEAPEAVNGVMTVESMLPAGICWLQRTSP